MGAPGGSVSYCSHHMEVDSTWRPYFGHVIGQNLKESLKKAVLYGIVWLVAGFESSV